MAIAVENMTPDLFMMFHDAMEKHDEYDMVECEVGRSITRATMDAVLEAGTKIIPIDMENVVHRIGCAYGLLDTVYDRAYRGLEIDETIEKMSKLLQMAVEGIRTLHQIDLHHTRLDFYINPTLAKA